MKNNISSYQWMAMLMAPVAPMLMMNFVKLFVRATGRGSCLEIILIAILTFLFLGATVAILKRNHFAPLHQSIATLWGIKPAKIMLFFVALAFLFFAIVALDIHTFIIKLYFLPKTPTIIIMLLLFLPTVYMAYCGFRTFTQMTTASILALILFLSIFLFTKNNYMASNLFPLTDFKGTEVITSLPFLFLPAPAIAASFILLPLCRDHQRLYTKSAIYAGIIAVLMLFTYAMGMMYFGETIISKLTLPFFNLSTHFKGNLLERFDVLFMLALLPSLSIFSAFGFSVFMLIQKDLLIQANTQRPRTTTLCWSIFTIAAALFLLYRLSLWEVYRWCNCGALILAGLLALINLLTPRKRRKTVC